MKGVSRLLVLATLLCPGCAVGPEYRAPVATLAATGPFVSTAPGLTPAAMPQRDWWRLYDDPAIDRLVTESLAANPDVRIARANLLAARALRDEAAAGRLPTTAIAGDANFGRNQRFVPGAGGDRFTWQGGFAVGYELDLFGRVSRSIDVASAEESAAEADVAAARVLIAAGVVDAYANACALSALIEVTRGSVGIAERSAALSELLQRAGSVGMLDVERSATLVASAQATLAPLERERRASLLSLAVLLGRPPSAIPVSAEQCRTIPAPRTLIPVGDGTSLLRRRPDIARAERMLAAQTARIGVATADLYPSIRLGGSVSWLGGVGASSGLNFGFGPLLSFNFPNRSVGRARVRQAEAATQAALAAFDGTVLSALREVEQAIDGYAAEQRRVAALQEAERRADRAYRLAETLQRAGSIGQLDLLVAQRTLFDARVERVRAEQSVVVAQITLFKALGGGWGNGASGETNAIERDKSYAS